MAYPPATVAPDSPIAGPMAGGMVPMPIAEPSAPQGLAPLTPTEVKAWWTRIELARARRKRESDRWKKLLKNLLPATGDTDTSTINSNIHFRNTYLKTAEMWGQLPELMLKPLEPLGDIRDPLSGQPIPKEDLVAIKREVLNKLLGRDGANLNDTIREALFDVFATSGIGATKICYEADIQYLPPTPPVAVPGAVLGLSQPPQPEPVAMYERWRWYRFSPMKYLQPHDWTSTDFDEAPWQAMEFIEPFTEAARRRYNLPDDFQSNVTKDTKILTSEQESSSLGSDQLIEGVEVWLKGARYDPNEANSQVYYRLVLIEGRKDAASVYERSPYQTRDPQGRLTPDSMLGNPIHPLVLRKMSDTAWVPADAAFTDPIVRQMNTWREQDIKIRESNIVRFVHSDEITQAIDKLKEADTGQGVAVPAAVLAQGIDRIIAQIPHLERSESDIHGEASLRRDLDETLGLGANQAGTTTSTKRSATENAIIAQNVSIRLKSEQLALMEWWLRGVRKFDSLIQRYATDHDYVEIIGQSGGRRLQAWNQHTIAGRYAYDAKPDTQLTMDAAQRIKKVLDFVNFMAKSPFMNQQQLGRIVALEFGYDPAQLIVAPPPPPPEKPRVSFAFGGPDLGIPEVRLILQGAGIQLPALPSPEAIAALQAQQAKQQPHGGASDKQETISKHHGELTGHVDGPPPLGAAPIHQPAAGVQ